MNGQLEKQTSQMRTAGGIGIILAALACAFQQSMIQNSALWAFGYNLLWILEPPFLFSLAGFIFGSTREQTVSPDCIKGWVFYRLIPLAVYTGVLGILGMLRTAQLLGQLWILAGYVWVTERMLRLGKNCRKSRMLLFAAALAGLLLCLLAPLPGLLESILKNIIWFLLGFELWHHRELLEEHWTAIWMTELMSWGVVILIAFQMTLGMIAAMTPIGIIQRLMLFTVIPPVIFSLLQLSEKCTRASFLAEQGEDGFWIALLLQPGCTLLAGYLYQALHLPIPAVIPAAAICVTALPLLLIRMVKKLWKK